MSTEQPEDPDTLTSEELAIAQNLRAFGIGFEKIGQQIKRPVQAIRKSMKLPSYDPPTSRPALPWETTGDVLATQPAPTKTSDR